MHLKTLGALLLFVFLATGCAGPSTPFGSVESFTPVAQVIVPKQTKKVKLKLVSNKFFQTPQQAKLSLTPDRQVPGDKTNPATELMTIKMVLLTMSMDGIL